MNVLPRIPETHFWGKYSGKVEQRVDPERLGRLKVRVCGIHADETPIEKLPWAAPCIPSYAIQSGEMNIPPIDTWVWVEFKGGDHEYPIWVGGAPSEKTKIDGSEETKHRVYPTSQFGGGTHGNGKPLKLESVKDVDPKNAPNNYGIVSPHQKRVELDDRKDRERIVLGDWWGNVYSVNSEVGVITLEAVCGIKNKTPKMHHFTLSADPDNPGVQLKTFNGWRLLIRDAEGTLEIKSPNNSAMVLIKEEDTNSTIEAWAGETNVKLDSEKDSVMMHSAAGAGVVIEKNYVTLKTKDEEAYAKLDNDSIDLRAKSVKIKSVGDLMIQSAGKVVIDGTDGVWLNTDKDNPDIEKLEVAPVAGDVPEPGKPIKAALDYPYYKSPE